MTAFETYPVWMRAHEKKNCSHCSGVVEPGLCAVQPDADVCLDCLGPKERRQLEADLRSVQEMNRSLLSRAEITAWDMGVYYRPARILSGDFYDIITGGGESAGETLSLAVGDVAGKGIPAALLRTNVQAILRVLTGQGLGPADLVSKTNEHLLDFAHPSRYATIAFAVLEPSSGLLRYTNAGHVPPLVRRASGSWESLSATGPVVGLLDNPVFEERSLELGTGDLLLLFTDGFTEAVEPSGRMIEEEFVMTVAERHAAAPASEIVARVVADLERRAPGDPSDDRTLLAYRRL